MSSQPSDGQPLPALTFIDPYYYTVLNKKRGAVLEALYNNIGACFEVCPGKFQTKITVKTLEDRRAVEGVIDKKGGKTTR